MTWISICMVLGVLLGLGTYLFLGAAMEGVGTTDPGFLKGLREGGWLVLLTWFLIWTGICAAIYWSWVGLHALLHMWGGT